MITRDQAIKPPIKTSPILEEPGYYVVRIDIFYQLHYLVGQLKGKELYIELTYLREPASLEHLGC